MIEVTLEDKDVILNFPDGMGEDAMRQAIDARFYKFDSEGSGYDYKTARDFGIKPDETGHWPSREPTTGLILKGRGHPTFDKTLTGEEEAGFKITKKDGRYYSQPKAKPLTLKDVSSAKEYVGFELDNIVEGYRAIKTTPPKQILNELKGTVIGRGLTETYGLLENVPSTLLGIAIFVSSIGAGGAKALTEFMKGKERETAGTGEALFVGQQKWAQWASELIPQALHPQTEAGQRYQQSIMEIFAKFEELKEGGGEQVAAWVCEPKDKECRANVEGYYKYATDFSVVFLPTGIKAIKSGKYGKIPDITKEQVTSMEKFSKEFLKESEKPVVEQKPIKEIVAEIETEVRKRPKTPEELAKEVEVGKGIKEAEAELRVKEVVEPKLAPEIAPEVKPEVVRPKPEVPKTEFGVSVEAISRLKGDKIRGRKMMMLDTRTGKEHPLIGVDAIDINPKPHEVKFYRNNDGTYEVIDKGIRAITEPEVLKVKPTPKVEPTIIKELKSRVDEAIGDVTPPVGMSIKTTPSQNLKSARDFKFESPELETRWKSAQGIRRVSIVDRGKVALKELWHKMSRGVYEHLPRTKEFSLIRTKLLRLARQKGVATDKALRNIQGITIKFNKPDRNLFDRKVILEDLRETVKEKKALPFGFKEESVIAELSRINAEVAKHPEITKAIQLRESLWDAIRQDYSQAMKDIGFDVSDRLVNKSYYRHQILDYVQAKGVFGTGARLRTPTGRGFLKKRKGSELDINVDYIQAEHEVMSQMLYDIEVAKTIKLIKDGYDISAKVKKDAKTQGLEDWQEAIPEGYEAWQPREGNVFYMSDSVPAKIAEQLLEGKFTEIGVKASDLQKAISLGKKRKEFVVKEEIAQTLDNLVRNKDRGRIMEIDRKLLRGWKVWQLISPRRFLKYNFRNLTGDADGAFLGNPSGFKKTVQASKELYEVFYGDKSMSPELQAWFERGGMETTLQAQEMGQINKLRIFQKQYEARFKVKDVPIKAWNNYWKTARLTTDFREAILRYANYLDYLEQMNKHPQGLPKNYGASLREEIQGLSNKRDKAFKMSNELLGAYDDISVLGQALREHIFPFWSWKEINMKRYYRVYKNAMRDGKLAQTTSRNLLKGTVTTPYKAYRIGKFLAKATAFWSALQVWNHSIFPEEEAELGIEKRSRPHIIFGRDKRGKIISFDRIGALGDFLEWFGLDAAPLYVDRWFKDRMTLKEIGVDMAKSPVNVIVQGLTPYFKTPAELLSQKAFFPDYSKPRTIRDNGLHIARSLGLGNEYKAIAGLPSEPYFESIAGVVVYKTDPGQAAYGDIYEEKKRFLKKIGKGGEGFWLTPRGDALYNMKLALRYGDDKAAEEYFMEYMSLGGSLDGLKTSLKNMSPLSGLTQIERIAFMGQLNEEDKRNLIKALVFYDEVLLGQKPKGE